MATNNFYADQTRSFTSLVAGTKVSHYIIISKIGAVPPTEIKLPTLMARENPKTGAK